MSLTVVCRLEFVKIKYDSDDTHIINQLIHNFKANTDIVFWDILYTNIT